MGLVTIRRAVTTDREHILRLDSRTESDPGRGSLIESAIDRAECLVALSDGIPVGYGVMNYSFLNRGFVFLVYVHAAHRRKGVGTGLFDEFERRCRTDRIFTSTNLSNLAMQGFLSSRGYVLSGIVHHLDPGDPEVFYSKELLIAPGR